MNIPTLSSTLIRRWSLADSLALPLVTGLVGLTTFATIVTAIPYSKTGAGDR